MATKNMQPIKLCENIDAMTDDQRAEMFTNGTHADMLEALRLMVDSATFDMDQKKDRETLRTFASQIAKVKTKVDNIGKDIVADWKEKAKRVDIVRKEIRDECDSLKEKARKPLTDWENAEAARIEARKAIINEIENATSFANYGIAKTSSEYKTMIDSLDVVFQGQASVVDEFTEMIEASYKNAHRELEQTLASVIEHEQEQEAKNKALQEQAEREKQLADQLAAEQAERERIQAEQQAEIERLKAELAAKNAPEPEPEQPQQSAQHEEVKGQLDLLSMPELVNAEDIAQPAKADESLNSKNKSMHVRRMLEGLQECSISIGQLIQSDLLDDVERHKITIASNRINQAQVLLAECI